MGRRKKLPQLEKLEGNPGKRPIAEPAVAAGGEPFVPEHLPDDAQACIEVIRRSMPPKVYSTLDSFALAAFATAWAVHKRAAYKINNPDFAWTVVSARGGEHPSPWIRILNDQARVMAALGDRLGLDPKSRAGLTLPEEKPRSKFDGLIAQAGSSRSLNA